MLWEYRFKSLGSRETAYLLLLAVFLVDVLVARHGDDGVVEDGQDLGQLLAGGNVPCRLSLLSRETNHNQ